LKRVLITGTGIVSAIGYNTDEVFNALLAEKTAVGFTTLIDTCFRDEIPVAEIKLDNSRLRKILDISPTGKPYTRATLLGMMAIREAMQMAGFTHEKEIRTGLISSTSVGGMDRTELFFNDYLESTAKGRLRDVVGHDCGSSTEDMAAFFGIDGFVTTISTACSSSANAIMLGARLIRGNILDRVIVGGVDALTKFTINGFNTLMILDRQPCRPFDETRAGLNIGEGAAFLVIESEELVKGTQKKVLAELKGYGNACDAYHQTASSPEGTGPRLAMQRAFDVAGLSPQDIGYVNVHGTGTPNNDLSEGMALEKIFNNKVPPFSSTKQFTGHTLGAAGSIEAVISVLAIGHDVVFPNLNHNTPMKELQILPNKQLLRNTGVRHVLSNSFGFGGNNTTLIFSKY